MKKLLSLLMMFSLMVALIAPIQADASTLKLNKSKATMEVDSTLKLKLGDLAGAKPTWTSSNKNIAAVSKQGVITAKKEGTTTITAKYNKKSYTCKVTVVDSNKKNESTTNNNSNTKNLNDCIKVIKEYKWDDDFYHYVALVVKNTSSQTVELNATMKMLDSNGKTIGAKNRSEYAFGKNTEMLLLFSNETAFSSYSYTLKAEKDKYYSCPTSNLSVSTNTTDEKAILEITNNGNVSAKFVEYYVLFFNNGGVVGYDWGYCVDSDSEIKPGNTEISEASCYEEFDNIKVYITSRADK